MDYRKLIAESLAYIEENLTAPITARELADRAGYSLYRYYRLFQSEVGMPVMRYILRRRLLGAVRDIRRGAKQIDAALMYGFDTHAGFYRAFRREFGCTPSQYLKNGAAERPRHGKETIMTDKETKPLKTVAAADFYEIPEYARLAGRALGRLHLKLKDNSATVDEVDLYETIDAWALPACEKLLQVPEAFRRDYIGQLKVLCPRLPRQIIHRDPNPSMFVITQDGWTLTPSPLSERNVRIYDPCYAATAVLSESFDEKDPEKLDRWLIVYRGIIGGYDEIVTLTDAERRAVPCVLLANQFICTAWFYEREAGSKLAEVNMRMTKWVVENFKRLGV